jgi:hypothetical protein
MGSDIEIGLQDVNWGDMDWVGLFQGRVSWLTSECGNEPLGQIKCGKFLDYVSNC